MNIKPFGNHILVMPVKKEQVLVSDAEQINAYGEVIAVGKDVKEIEIGDIIGFTKWGIRELEVEGEKYFFIPEDDEFLLGTIEVL